MRLKNKKRMRQNKLARKQQDLAPDEFTLIDESHIQPGQKRLIVKPTAKNWMITKEDFSDPSNPVVEVAELEI